MEGAGKDENVKEEVGYSWGELSISNNKEEEKNKMEMKYTWTKSFLLLDCMLR